MTTLHDRFVDTLDRMLGGVFPNDHDEIVQGLARILEHDVKDWLRDHADNSNRQKEQ